MFLFNIKEIKFYIYNYSIIKYEIHTVTLGSLNLLGPEGKKCFACSEFVFSIIFFILKKINK